MNEFELIEDYLKGKLQGQALKDFESKLASNSTFASKVEGHRAMQDMIFTKGLIETREKLQAIRKEKIGKEGGKGGWFKGIGFIVLSLLVLTTIVVLIQRENTSEKNKTEKVVDSEIIVSTENKVKSGKQEEDITLDSKNIQDDKKTGAEKSNPIISSDPIWSQPSASLPIDANHDSSIAQNAIPLPNVSTVKGKDTLVLKHKDQNTSVRQETVPKSLPKIPCAHVNIKAEIQMEESCHDKATGKLHVSEVTGGKAPYKFSLGNSGASGTSSHFDHLNAGNYQILIKDANGCTAVLESSIVSKFCAPDKSNIFAPDYGETWKFPISAGGDCHIRIYNAAGNMVYEVNTVNGNPAEWNGVGSNDSYIKAGAYLYQITCKDGKISQGSVTVTR